jgi:mannose-6-phosphate isomerase-like protein (cupin superfamily)
MLVRLGSSAVTRPPVDHIAAPPFPRPATWINVASLRMDQQRGRPVLIEFWDFCRPNSLRTQPYLRGWDERYRDAGLRVIGVHSSGFPPSAEPAAVTAAVARLGIEYAVIVDAELAVWRDYDNLGWPARYLFDGDGMLFDYHFGEGGYVETERAIQSLLDVTRDPLDPVRPEDDESASLVVQSDDVAGPYSGPYEAGEVWAVLEGSGTVTANDQTVEVDHPGAYRLLRHEVSTAGTLSLQVGEGVVCHATCFAPGLAS